MFEKLAKLEESLRARGLDASAAAIAAIRADADLVDRPPGFFRRALASVRDTAALHWARVLQELGESRELYALIERRVRTGEPLSDEQADAVRAQLLDIFRLVPGGAIAVSAALVPIPGTVLLTPIVLKRLGLLPSSWREASVLERLSQQRLALARGGHSAAAEEIARLLEEAQREGGQRWRLEALERNSDLFAFYDRDDDGQLDRGERAGYEAACAAVVEDARLRAAHRIWYVSDGDEVRGPFRLAEVSREDLSAEAWLCVEDRHQWVPLALVPVPIQEGVRR